MHFLKNVLIRLLPRGPQLWVYFLIHSISFGFLTVIWLLILSPSQIEEFNSFVILSDLLFYLLFVVLFWLAIKINQSPHGSILFTVMHLCYLGLTFLAIAGIDYYFDPRLNIAQLLPIFTAVLIFKFILNCIHQDLKEGWQTRLWNFNARPETKKINYRPELN